MGQLSNVLTRELINVLCFFQPFGGEYLSSQESREADYLKAFSHTLIVWKRKALGKGYAGLIY